MKKRLRKKYHVGEFVQYGFEVEIHLKENTDENEREEVMWAFIIEAIEPNHLLAGGGGSNPMSFFVVADGYKSATIEHINKLKEWLSKQEQIESFSFGPLKDAWHGEAV